MMRGTQSAQEDGIDDKSSPSPWQEICLSPGPSWSPAPPVVHVGEDDNSPTSLFSNDDDDASPSRFDFGTPKPLKTFFPTPKATGHHQQQQQQQQRRQVIQQGFFSDHLSHRRHWSHQATVIVLFVALFFGGATSWNVLQAQSHDPIELAPPPGSPSDLAKQAFARHSKYDWGASPSFWVILESSPSKRSRIATSDVSPDSHSFTDDTSVAYSQGKQFCMGLSEYLQEKFQMKKKNDVSSDDNNDARLFSSHPMSIVKTTSYYSLQEQGLDYIARNMVTPDGAKTMIQIQYLQDELKQAGMRKLKESILAYGDENPPDYLDVHYIGLFWNPRDSSINAYAFVLGAAVFLFGGTYLVRKLDMASPLASWGLLIVASTVTTLSASAIGLSNFSSTTMTPLSLSALAMVSFTLSVFYSKFQIDNDCNSDQQTVRWSIIHNGSVLMSTFASLYILSSPTIKSVSVASTTGAMLSTFFHAFLAPKILKSSQSMAKRDHMKAQSNKSRPQSLHAKDGKVGSLTARCIVTFFFLLVAYQSRRHFTKVVVLDGNVPIAFHQSGDHFGHGRLTPYRILFDGHKPNQSMVSLAGYDIVQMLVDELMGIYIPNGDESEDSAPVAGSTHVAEEFGEVQQLIKNLVDTLRLFKEEQQREFDRHHQQRKEQWEQRQIQEESNTEDIRCDYKFNGGISATTYSGIAVFENSRIPQSLHSAANICRGMSPKCPSEALHMLNVLEDETTTNDNLATFVTVNLGVDPFSWEGSEWLRLARETTRRLQADPRVTANVEIHIDGPAARLYDFNRFQREVILSQLWVVVAIFLLTLVVSFRSCSRSLGVITRIGLSMVFATGAGVLLFGDKVLPWLATIGAGGNNQENYPAQNLHLWPVSMSWLLPITSILTAENLSRKRAPGLATDHSMPPSTKLIVASLLLLTIALSISNQFLVHWPLIAVAALVTDELWVKKMWLLMVSEFLTNTSSQILLEPVDTNVASCFSVQSRHNEAYLTSYEKFVLSPQAP